MRQGSRFLKVIALMCFTITGSVLLAAFLTAISPNEAPTSTSATSDNPELSAYLKKALSDNQISPLLALEQIQKVGEGIYFITIREKQLITPQYREDMIKFLAHQVEQRFHFNTSYKFMDTQDDLLTTAKEQIAQNIPFFIFFSFSVLLLGTLIYEFSLSAELKDQKIKSSGNRPRPTLARPFQILRTIFARQQNAAAMEAPTSVEMIATEQLTENLPPSDSRSYLHQQLDQLREENRKLKIELEGACHLWEASVEDSQRLRLLVDNTYKENIALKERLRLNLAQKQVIEDVLSDQINFRRDENPTDTLDII
jgi:hypothetical protein